MEIINGFEYYPARYLGGALAIGKFDGLHRGHVRILEQLGDYAKKYSIPSVVFTFDPPPKNILRPDLAPPFLTILEQKMELMEQSNVDLVIVQPTTQEFLNWSAKYFFDEVICKTIQAKVVIEGKNFGFGRNREGTPELLESFCREKNIIFEVISSIRSSGYEISSSRIRSLLMDGYVETAREMLVRPYRLTGTVIHGEHRGQTLGFPTANLGNVQTLIPKNGIYAAVSTVREKQYATAVHIGDNPTFGETPSKIEAFLIDFSGDIYGETLHVDFFARLRDITAFPSKDALIEQMNRDVQQVLEMVNLQE